MCNSDDIFGDLESSIDEIETRKTKREAAKEQFPCMRCNGTGLYQGVRLHQAKQHCFSCKGKGFFMTSPEQRSKARKSAATRKATKAASRWDDFKSEHTAAAEWLESNSERSNFAQSLRDSIFKFGSLTERQLAAVNNIIAKDEDRAQERAKASLPAATVDLGAVFAKFANARESGIKRPKLRLDGFCFTLAKGRNEGSLYVKAGPAWEDTYLGKVSPAGEFVKSRDCSQEQVDALVAISQDVLAAAQAYGQVTGSCSCCGRELTNADSIELGIGPICLENWGM